MDKELLNEAQTYQLALQSAVRMLAARQQSAYEIHSKLMKKGYSEETADLVLLKLKREHLLDDQAFSVQWARYRSSCRLGPRRIRYELRQKGIDESMAEEAMEQLSEDEQLANAIVLAEKTKRAAKAADNRDKIWQRAYGTLARRGYSSDVIRKAMSRVFSRDGEEEEYDE